MRPSFANIQFGPFASSYHREVVDDTFKASLSDYLEVELLPQIEQPYQSTNGQLTASYNDQKYCGPLSAVRDIYKFEFAFQRASGDDTIKTELVFDPKTRVFAPGNRQLLYLWTASRRQRYQQQRQAIQELCRRLAEHDQVAAVCPLCSARLRVVDSPALFDVSCPERCFNYNFHRDPTSEEFLHGHFFQRKTVHTG